MKQNARGVGTASLVIVTVLALVWNSLVLAQAKTLVLMLNVAAPSSALYERTLKDVCEVSTLVYSCAVIPMALLALIWMFAFLRLRQKAGRIEKQLQALQTNETSDASR